MAGSRGRGRRRSERGAAAALAVALAGVVSVAGFSGRAAAAGASRRSAATTVAPDNFVLDRYIRGLDLPGGYEPITLKLTPNKDLEVCGVARPVISAEATRAYTDSASLLMVKVYSGPEGGLNRYFKQLSSQRSCTEANGQKLIVKKKPIGRLGGLEIRGAAKSATLNGVVSFVHTKGYLVAVQMVRPDIGPTDVALVETVQRTVTARLASAPS